MGDVNELDSTKRGLNKSHLIPRLMLLHETKLNSRPTAELESALESIKTGRLEEQTADQLIGSTKRAFPTTKREIKANSDAKINSVAITGNQRQKFILAKFDIQGKTDQYKTSIKIEQATITDEPTGTTVEIAEPTGDTLNAEPTLASKNNVKLRCTCKDFTWRFSRQDAKVKALNGPVPSLQSKGLRPSVNPTWAPGACKHIHAALDHLKKIGILK